MIEVVIDKPGTPQQRHRLGGGIYGLGRNVSNEIVLDDQEVSRHHARLLVEGEQVVIEDLDSGNGTFIGGLAVRDAPLGIGDVVEIVPFVLRVEQAEDETEEAPEEPCYLDCIDGPVSGQRFELVGDALSTGRSDDQDIPIKDPGASRSHALFIKRPSGWTVRDNNSANGLMVNGQRLREAPLQSGDEIQLGNTVLRFIDPNVEDEEGLDLDEATLEANAMAVVGADAVAEHREKLLDEPAPAPAPAAPKAAPAPAADGQTNAMLIGVVAVMSFIVLGVLAMALTGQLG
jgi:pSer/pThr/pTyr-binding forkhead associated (FHA) protein